MSYVLALLLALVSLINFYLLREKEVMTATLPDRRHDRRARPARTPPRSIWSPQPLFWVVMVC